MTWKFVVVGVVSLSLTQLAPDPTGVLTPTPADVLAPADDPPTPAAADETPAKPLWMRAREYTDSYMGTAVAVGEDWITAQAPGQNPRRFVVRGEPLEGRPPNTVTLGSYLLSDVRVGDQVILRYHHKNGLDTCLEILIRRRPGGRVPPQPGSEDLPARFAWHVRCNAEQDWEEKGIALPPEYANPPSPLLNPPYPPVAPTPRALPPRPARPEPDDLPPDAETVAKPRSLAKAESVELVNGSFEGSVSATGDGWLLIRPDGGPVRRFLASDLLAAGRAPAGSDRLSGVRVGDRVEVWYDRFDGENVCREVKVTRRADPAPAIPAAKE